MNDTIEEKKRFLELLTGISDYYGKPLSKTTLALYWQGLRAFDFEAVERALWQHTQSPDECGRWMPTISDLTKMMHGRTADQASLAWSKVNLAVRQVGVYVDAVFDDPLIHRVLADMGGWASLATKEEKEWPFIAKEFENRYRGYKMSDQRPDYPRVLTGMANAQNSAAGMDRQGARLIGDRTLCIAVARGEANAQGQAAKLEAP
jgi:hypothetical protein